LPASALDKNLPLEKANKFAFLLAYSVFSLYLADAEYRMRLNKTRKNGFFLLLSSAFTIFG